jgi:hypothetical protein
LTEPGIFLWEDKKGANLTDLVDGESAERVLAALRKSLKKNEPVSCFAKRHPQLRLPGESGAPVYCLIEIVRGRSQGKIVAKVWHLPGFLEQLALRVASSPGAWFMLAILGFATFVLPISAYFALQAFGQKPEHAVTGALLVLLSLTVADIHEALRHFAGERIMETGNDFEV